MHRRLVLPTLGLLLIYALPLRIIWTWIFNNTKGSILIAILLHAATDAAISLVFYQIITTGIHLSGWQAALFGGRDFRVCALLIIIFTRDYLSYKPNLVAQSAAEAEQVR